MDFKRPYNKQDYVSFFRNQLLPEDFESREEKVTIGFQTEVIQNAVILGRSASLELSVYEIEHKSENDPRVSVSRESFRLMAHYGIKRALILFTSPNSQNYRLSLVTIDLKWDEGKKVQKEYSNPRRYSFFLGPNTRTHTPEEYLVTKGRVKDFEDLKNRFSIEVVNKEFYTQIAVMFTKLAGGKRQIGRQSIDEGSGCLKLPSIIDDTVRKEFAVRLIGRLVFCWFLKKKHSDKNIPLLPEELLSSEAVQNNYYHKALEPLFFQVLNTPISERLEDYRTKPWSIIPFLNGGLFTPHQHDFYETGVLGISVYINTLKIPDGWFNELFDIFETYNFTIDENTSVDVELSIEPEMLGRIFENLLAEINPETGETARKATGSYYTPRPIVEYMVDESLRQHLLTKTVITEDKIASLLSYEDVETGLSEKEKEEIIDALDVIKIIDPACGSGAFPMGILQKMLLVLQKVDPNSQRWLAKKITKIENNLLRRDLESKLKSENFNYIHKLGIIQSSIYGVDIQPIAIDLSKLRFFLSLIVDEEVNDSKVNRGVKHLPNLEFKFVCANSLIGLSPKIKVPTGKPVKRQSSIFKETEQLDWFEAADEINKLKELREEYLQSYGKRKKDIEKEFSKVQKSMFEHSLKWSAHDSQTLQLSMWEPFSDKPCSWFDSEWMFGIKDGFDVVIANPPYGALFTNDEKEYLFTTYPLIEGQPESYEYFLFVALHKFSQKNGITSYIVPTNFIESKRAQKLRETILNCGLVHVLSNFRFNVWENNAAETLIFIYQKNVRGRTKVLHPNTMDEFLKGNNTTLLNQDEWFKTPGKRFIIRANSTILHKILKGTVPLGSITEVSQGIIVYKTRVESKRNPYISDKKTSDIWKKLLDGKSHVEPYKIMWGGNYLKYGDWLWCPREEKFFKSPKIIFIRLRNKSLDRKLVGAFDDSGFYNRDNFNNIIAKDKNYSLKYILAVFNSTLINYWYKSYFDNVNINPEQVRMIPLIKTSEQQPFIEIVDGIIDVKNNDSYSNDPQKLKQVKVYEKRLDQMIYDLYGLMKEEIDIVEGAGKK